jgi:hypothetical protein
VQQKTGFAFEARLVTVDNVVKPIKVIGDYICGARDAEDLLVGVISIL